MPGAATDIFGLVLLVWLVVLSYLLYKERTFLKQLFPKDSSQDIRAKFEEVLQSLEDTNKREEVLHRNLREFARDGLHHIQKVEVLRYNPYGDTGGDQSFSVVLLDGTGKGVVISSLHTRAGTRVYTKGIENGRSELKLSKEEEAVLNKALI